MSKFAIFYGLLAIGLLIVWIFAQFQMVYRAKSNRLWQAMMTVAALILCGVTVVMIGDLSDKVTGLGSALILLVLAFWPKGLTKNSVVANVNTIRQFAAISKIELTPVESVVELKFFAGEMQIAKLKFNVAQKTLVAFLQARIPKKRLVINKG